MATFVQDRVINPARPHNGTFTDSEIRLPKLAFGGVLVAGVLTAIFLLFDPARAALQAENTWFPVGDRERSSTTRGTDANFESEVLDAQRPVLVDFWAPWCGPCRRMNPIIESIAKEYAGRLKVVKVRLEDAPKVVRSYGVEGIPHFVIFKGGQVRAERIGVQSKRELIKFLEPYLK